MKHVSHHHKRHCSRLSAADYPEDVITGIQITGKNTELRPGCSANATHNSCRIQNLITYFAGSRSPLNPCLVSHRIGEDFNFILRRDNIIYSYGIFGYDFNNSVVTWLWCSTSVAVTYRDKNPAIGAYTNIP